MFSNKNHVGGSLLLAIIVVGLILMPNSMNQPVNAQVADAGLTVTPHTVTVGTCTRSGTYTQKFVHNPSARSSYTTHWSPGLPELALGYQITVDGYGYVQASINYNVGSSTGSHTWPPLKVGSWGHRGALSLWAPYATRVTAYTAEPPPISFARIDNHAYGEYTWSSSGTITLQAKYCKRTSPFWCEWEDLGSPSSESFSGSGSWTLAKTFVCPNCSQDVPHTNYHKTTCSAQTYQRTDGRGVYRGMGYYPGCGETYWGCSTDAITDHNRRKCQTDNCGLYDYECGDDHDCEGMSDQEQQERRNGGGTGGSTGSTGTTTSPTVSNNGGTVNNNGGGTGGSDTRVRCGHGNACSRGGYASSREAHKTTCPAGHSYYTCSATGTSRHANCRARRSGEVRCGNGSWCRSGGWASSRNAHKVTCAAGHSYWGCNPTQVRRHRNCRS